VDELTEAGSLPANALILALVVLGAVLRWRVLAGTRTFETLVIKYRLPFALLDIALFLLGAHAAGQVLIWIGTLLVSEDSLPMIRQVARLLFFLAVATGIGRLIEVWILAKDGAGQKRRVSQLARTLLYGTCWLVALIAFLNVYGHYSHELWISTGAAAALLAFATQQTLGDLFSGIALSIEKPFRIGDWLRFADGTEGEVTNINWRATRLRGWDNATFIVPNSQLSREKFTNLHGPGHRYQPWYTVRVSGDADPRQVKALLEKAADRCDSVMSTPRPVARLMQASTVPYTYMIWVTFENYPAMFGGREELYREIDAALASIGLEVAAEVQEIRHRPAGPTAPPAPVDTP